MQSTRSAPPHSSAPLLNLAMQVTSLIPRGGRSLKSTLQCQSSKPDLRLSNSSGSSD